MSETASKIIFHDALSYPEFLDTKADHAEKALNVFKNEVTTIFNGLDSGILQRISNLPPDKQNEFWSEAQKAVQALEAGNDFKVYIPPSQSQETDTKVNDVPLPNPLVLSKDYKKHPLTKDLKNNLERFEAVWKTSIDAGISREKILETDPQAIKKVYGYCNGREHNKRLSVDDILPPPAEGTRSKPNDLERKKYLQEIIHPDDRKAICQMELASREYHKNKANESHSTLMFDNV